MKLFIRLTSDINARLRGLLRYRGNLSRFVEEAVTTTDLYRVPLLSSSGVRGTKGTTASTDSQSRTPLKEAATYRKRFTKFVGKRRYRRVAEDAELRSAPTSPVREASLETV